MTLGRIASALLLLLVLLLAACAALLHWGWTQYRAAGPLDEPVCLHVKRGDGIGRVAAELDERGAIRDRTVFLIATRYSGAAGRLKAGSWLIPPRSSMSDLADAITRGGAGECASEVVYRIGVASLGVALREFDAAQGRVAQSARFDLDGDAPPPPRLRAVAQRSGTRFRVVLAEGATSWQAAQALAALDALAGEVGEIPPEGSLAPGDYAFRAGDERAALIARMRETQSALLAAAWQARAPDIPLDTPDEALILASIIEKETGLPEERAKVASVFANRLRRGMRLQTDPTVVYGITGGRAPLGRGLRRSELKARTPYNTYVVDGLPPTPIANPGKASLEAAVRPAQTEHLYFVADGTGGHAFSRTLDEHLANVAKWRRIERERGAD